MKKAKCEAAAQRRPVQSERKKPLFFPRNAKPDGLKREVFQTEKARKGTTLRAACIAYCSGAIAPHPFNAPAKDGQ